MKKKQRKNLPARGWHVPAAVLAVLLTVALWATQLGLVGIQIMTDTGLHERVALDAAAVDIQMARIREGIGEIAEEFGFREEPVAALITRTQVEDMDRRIVAWWTGFMNTGEIEEAPAFHAGLEATLEADTDFTGKLNALAVHNTIESVESRVNDMVRKTGILFREQLVEAGIRRVESRVSLSKIIELVKKLPALGGAFSLLAAGLIAAMMSRKIQMAGRYIGGAMSGCGLLMLATLALVRASGFGSVIGEASEALYGQYSHLARIISLEVIGGAALLMVLGGLGMALAVRARRQAA